MEQCTTFGMAFYIRQTRLNKHGETAIQLRINRMQADTTAKETINLTLWHAGRGRAIEKNPLAKEINMYLDAVRARITRITGIWSWTGKSL